MNDIITELSDKIRLIFNKIFSSVTSLDYILSYIIGIFDDCKYISDKYPFVIPLSAIVSIIFSILKSRKDGRLKKCFLSGFFIFTGAFVVSEIIWRLLLSPEFLPHNIEVFIFYGSMFAESIFITNSLTLFSAYVFMKRKRGAIMKDFKINFELKNINDVDPWGDNTIDWFALTDGTLYIQVGDDKIYEYSDSARDFFKCDIKYNDYYLERFVCDFTWIFRFIREPIPKILYDNIDKFEDITDLWKNMYEDKPDDIFDEFYFGEYSTLTEWYYMQHTFDSAHLVGGPHIGFFRYGDNVKILWKSYDNAVLENGKNIWTSPNGVYEISWNDFIKEVEAFYWKFRREMDSRTDYIYKHGLTHAQTDRELLLHSNSNSIIAFGQNLALLFSDDYEKTDFDHILFLYEKMRSEINEQELQEISDD